MPSSLALMPRAEHVRGGAQVWLLDADELNLRSDPAIAPALGALGVRPPGAASAAALVAPSAPAPDHPPGGVSLLGQPRQVVTADDHSWLAMLEDRGVRGAFLRCVSDGAQQQMNLPLAFADICCDGASVAVTVHKGVHPDCELGGKTISLATASERDAEHWLVEMKRATETVNSKHWGISKAFIREQQQRWKAEGKRCKGMTVHQYFEDLELARAYDDTWSWCAGALAAEEASDLQSRDLKSIAYFRSKIDKTEMYEDMELTDYMNVLKHCDLVPSGKKVSYADFIAEDRDGSGRRKVGCATVFVSHVWRMTAADFFEVCLAEMADEDYAWIDLYLHNQYQGAVSDIGAENSEYWVNKFGSLIAGIGKVIAIVTNWESPVMLARIWCLFELNAAVDAGAELRFVSTLAEKQDLSLHLNEKFQSLDRVVGNIEVRNCDAKRPHEIQDKSIFLSKLSGMEDEVNEKLRKQMQSWLCKAAEGVIARTDPFRAVLDEAAMALEAVDIGQSRLECLCCCCCGRGGAKLTRLLERWPQLPLMLLFLSIPVAMLVIWYEEVSFRIGINSGSSADDSTASLDSTLNHIYICFFGQVVAAPLLLFGSILSKHQAERQLRRPPLICDCVTQHAVVSGKVGCLLAAVTLYPVYTFCHAWLEIPVGASVYEAVVLAGLPLFVLGGFVLRVQLCAAADRASLRAKAGQLRLRLGDAEGAATSLGQARAELLRTVGSEANLDPEQTTLGCINLNYGILDDSSRCACRAAFDELALAEILAASQLPPVPQR